MIRLALALTLIGGALAGCNTSYSYFEDEPDPAMEGRDTTLFGTMLTMSGAVPAPKSAIDYKPRAPLAMPGDTSLPSPQSGSEVEAAVNFPTDHDEVERQRRRRLAELGEAAAYEKDPLKDGNPGPMKADEAAKLRREGGGQRRTTDSRAAVQRQKNSWGKWLSAREMKTVVTGGRRRAPILTEDGNSAPREYLIQPPDSYRTPAETAALPAKRDIENSDWLKKQLYKGIPDHGPAYRMQK